MRGARRRLFPRLSDVSNRRPVTCGDIWRMGAQCVHKPRRGPVDLRGVQKVQLGVCSRWFHIHFVTKYTTPGGHVALLQDKTRGEAPFLMFSTRFWPKMDIRDRNLVPLMTISAPPVICASGL